MFKVDISAKIKKHCQMVDSISGQPVCFDNRNYSACRLKNPIKKFVCSGFGNSPKRTFILNIVTGVIEELQPMTKEMYEPGVTRAGDSIICASGYYGSTDV
jgi:hypothetical protein